MFDCLAEQADRQEDSHSYVVVDPQHMCHHMFKAILSPRDFPGSHLIFPKHGVIEECELDNALFQAGVDPAAGKSLLLHSKVCTPVVFQPQPGASDAAAAVMDCTPRRQFFPIHVQHTQAPSDAWSDDGKTIPLGGFQLHSPNIPVSPSYLPSLQLELVKELGPHSGITEKSLIWKTGMVIDDTRNVSVMVSDRILKENMNSLRDKLSTKAAEQC